MAGQVCCFLKRNQPITCLYVPLYVCVYMYVLAAGHSFQLLAVNQHLKH